MTESLKLPTVTIYCKDGVIVITHTKTGMKASISPARLNSWAMRILREELSGKAS